MSALEQRDLHSIGILKPDVAVPPRGEDGWMHQRRTMGEQTLHGLLQIRNLQGEANPSTQALAGFDPVDRPGLGLIEQFQGSASHFEHDGASPIVAPRGSRVETKALAIEAHEALVVGGREGDTQFQNRISR